jgi:hypothetical protein
MLVNAVSACEGRKNAPGVYTGEFVQAVKDLFL